MNTKEKRIAIIEYFLPHYRIDIYKKIIHSDFHHVNFYSGNPPNSSYSIGKIENERYLKNYYYFNGRILIRNIFKRELYRHNIYLIRASIRDISLPFLLLILKLKEKKIILWGHGYSRKRKYNSDSITNRYYRVLIRLANKYICYTEVIYNTLAKKIDKNKLHVFTNTIKQNPITDKKLDFNLNNKKNEILFIGRLTKRKRVLYAIDVFNDFNKKNNNRYRFNIVGDGSFYKKVEEYINKNNIKGVYLHGRIYEGEILNKIMDRCKLCFMPGGLGLAVNHCFSKGLPVVSERDGKENILHGPEADYVIDGYNGFFSETNNKELTIKYIEMTLNNIVQISRNAKYYYEQNLDLDTQINKLLLLIKDVQS